MTPSARRLLTRRDFLRLAALAGGSVVLSPLLKACRPDFPVVTPDVYTPAGSPPPSAGVST